jgi:hypothetical protein
MKLVVRAITRFGSSIVMCNTNLAAFRGRFFWSLGPHTDSMRFFPDVDSAEEARIAAVLQDEGETDGLFQGPSILKSWVELFDV